MKSRRRRRGEGIDITPLIDVLFMLIIFLVLTTTFTQGRIDVDLPEGKADSRGQKNAVLISVTEKSAILWNGRPIALDEAVSRSVSMHKRGADVRIAGDRNAPYGTVAELLEALRAGGVDTASLVLDGNR